MPTTLPASPAMLLRAEVRRLGALPKAEMELVVRALDLPRLCDLARAAGLPVCSDRRRLEARCVHGFSRHAENASLHLCA